MSGIKRYLSDNAYKAAEHSESPSESNPFVTLHKAIAMRSDWNQSNSSADNYIKNKPAIKAGQGANSIIEGNIVNNVVSGGYAHAEGNGTEASGDYGSHAEGNGTTASGMCSHAEGNGTTASGFSSHAEGNETIASGRASHAEGNSTTASEENSHAEGTGTAASGFSSHAEGVNTTASGNYSHAEGVGTTASGTNSHTEGLASTASGDYSHAEGSETIANNKCQHVFGEYNGVDPSSALSSARGTYIEIVGNGTTSSARSNARTLDWSGNETLTGNLTVGGTITANGQQILPQVQVDWNQTTSTGSDYIKNKPTIKAGQGENSIIEGDLVGNSSTGTYSHAEGGVTTASGPFSHAEGGVTTATGSYSHVEGYKTTASGPFSHAEGNETIASGYISHTEGYATTANHKSQHVFGEYNGVDPSTAPSWDRGTYIEIVGKGSNEDTRSNARTLDWQGNETLAGNLTIGGTITANGQQILPQVQVDWNQTTSTGSDYIKNKPAIKAGLGENSIVEGSLIGNSSSGSHSHAEGAGATASGPFSHAEGSGTTASGDASHAEGYNTTASGINSHAEGYMATASGGSSHAEGSGTKASGGSSHAEGSGTTASGDASHAEGYNTTAKGKSQHVFGEFNKLDPSTASSWTRGNYVEIVGNGANNTARSNARTLDWSGNEVLAGTITANGVNLNDELNLKEPLLPVTPIQPESKFLNGNRQWVEIGGGGGLTTVYKSITIENPTASENMCIFYAPVAMTITEIRGVITGATSVSFKVVSGTSRNAVTTEHNSSAVVCSSVTTGDVATITTAAVAAGSWVAVKTSAIAGAPSELVITLSLTF